MVKIIIQSNLPYSQISVYKGQLHFPQCMNNAYNLNSVYTGQVLIKGTFSGSLEWPLYTGFTALVVFRRKLNKLNTVSFDMVILLASYIL